MTTTQPIAGNQFFKEVFNQAAQLPILQVEDLEIGTATTGFLEVVRTNVSLGTNYSGAGAAVSKDPSLIRLTLDNFGHILTAQQVPPVFVRGDPDGAPGGVLAAKVLENSTDTAGQVQLTWTAAGLAANTACSVRMEFNRDFPSKDLSVQLTAADKVAAMLVSGEGTAPTLGVFVQSDSSSFEIHFTTTGAGIDGEGVATFNYFVTDPVEL